MPPQDPVTTIGLAVDAILNIAPCKTAVTDPELRQLVRIAQLRRQAARKQAAIGAPYQEALWQRLVSTLRAARPAAAGL